MVMAGEGTTATATATAYEGGGAGGKTRKLPARKSKTTPYERPLTAFRNPSWLSKLVVDPASKLISAGAQRFFSSVFSKRLGPPPPPPHYSPESNQESRNGLDETVSHVRNGLDETVSHVRNGLDETVPHNQVGPQEPAEVVGGNRTCNNGTSGISELEQLLKQKSFTKSEIDRLTDLLHSRAVDSPVKDDGIMSNTNPSIQNNFSKPMPDTQKQFPIPLEGSKTEKASTYGAPSTATVSKMVLEDEIASPAELAKVYMESRPSKVSPSKLGFRSPVARKDVIVLNNSTITSNSPITLLGLNTTGPLRTPGNIFTTPRSRGRSAIYNMARTPYSRVHPSSVQKVSGSRNYDYAGPSSSASQSVWENGGLVAFKPAALKRRSSALDDDIGSVGPIRRIRQKSNLSSQGTSHPSRGNRLGSDASQLQNLSLMNVPSTNHAHIPRESSEMAARIFEQLEKMTPKEKSSQSKLAAAREISSVAPNMLRGQALSSVEDFDASKLLQNSQNDHKLGDQPSSSQLHPLDSATQRQGKVEENGFTKFVHPHDKLAPVEKSAANLPKFTPQSSERKRAFKMSACEEFLELDDDLPSNKRAFKSAEGKGSEKLVMDGKSIDSEGASDTTPVSSEVQTHPVSLSLKSNVDGTSNAPITGEDSHASAKAITPSDSPLPISFSPKSTGSVPFSTVSKAERSSSLVNGSTLDTSDTNSSQLFNGTANGQLGTVFSAGAPSSDLSSKSGLLAEPTHSNTEISDLKFNAGKENGFDKLSKSSFGTFSSPPVFSASKITSSTSGSIFSSSAPATKEAVSEAMSTQTSLATTSPTGTFKFAAGSSAANAISFNSSVTPSFSSFGATSSSSAISSSSSTMGVFGFSASSAFSSSSATSGSGTTPSTFSFAAGNPGSSSSVAAAVSSSGVNSSTFGSSWQASNSPINGSTPSNGFTFGASSSSLFGTTNSSPMAFGPTTGPSSSPIFSFSTVSSTTPSSPIFAFSNVSPFATSPGSNDRMSTEDSMAEDRMQSPTPAGPVFGQSPTPADSAFGQSPTQAVSAFGQSPTPAVPAFGQSPISPSPNGFAFGSTVPSTVAPFQFGGQAAPQTPSQFQPSGSLEGGFSLGSGGPDKSSRRVIKVNRNRNKKR